MTTSDKAGGEKASGPRAVMRVLDILDLVASRPDGCTLTEIAATLHVPKTSAFSLLKTMEGGGYLRPVQGRYLLGAAATRLGTAIARAGRFPGSARPVMEQIARDTGETILLGTLSDEGHEVAYIDIVESEAPLRFTIRAGNRRPLYCAAAGKAILAFLPARVQKAYLKTTSFVRFTADTSDRAELVAMLPGIRQRAVVVDANGIVDGATAVASPCFDEAGQVHCAISIAGPTGRILARREDLEHRARRAGEEISRICGYGGPYPPPALSE